jgi:hypothetical protein
MRYDTGYRGTRTGGFPPRGGYDRGSPRPGAGSSRGGYPGGFEGIHARSRGGEDLWWLGNAGYDRSYRQGPYAADYQAFDRANRPRYSPVGGMQAGMGSGRPPAPLRYDRWFSEWTRWF